MEEATHLNFFLKIYIFKRNGQVARENCPTLCTWPNVGHKAGGHVAN